MKDYVVTFTTSIEVEAEDWQEAREIATDLFITGEGNSDVVVEEI